MFPRMNITTPLPSFAYCPPQYSAGVGFGGINPMVPYMANPYVSSPSPAPYPVIGPSPYVSSPSPIPYPVIGPSPYAIQPILPYPPGPLSAGISPISPWYSPLSWSPYAFAPPTPAYPATHPALAGLAPSIFGSPVTYIDPATGTVVPQPYPAAQSLLPIRPLITAHTDPVQMAAMCGMMGMTAPPMVDPYSVMTQMPSPMSIMSAVPPVMSPVPPVMRSPLYMSPIGSSPVGVPYAVTAGIPC
jgi:hypothetical protein